MQTKKLQIKKRVVCKYQVTADLGSAKKNGRDLNTVTNTTAPETTSTFPTTAGSQTFLPA